MRFLRISLPSKFAPANEHVRRTDILMNQNLGDDTMIELCCIEADSINSEWCWGVESATIEQETLHENNGMHYMFRHFNPHEDSELHQLISGFTEHQLLVICPINFARNNGISLTVIGATEYVQAAFSNLPSKIGQAIEVHQITEQMPAIGNKRSDLTDRQREVLDTAVKLGYYSVPRRATAGDVADIVGCAPSTTSEHLRKIESRIVADLAG